MSSSPAAAVFVESAGLARPSVLELLDQIPDPRARRGVRHRFAPVLAVAVAAVVAGARSFVAIGEWVTDADAGVLAMARAQHTVTGSAHSRWPMADGR